MKGEMDSSKRRADKRRSRSFILSAVSQARSGRGQLTFCIVPRRQLTLYLFRVTSLRQVILSFLANFLFALAGFRFVWLARLLLLFSLRRQLIIVHRHIRLRFVLFLLVFILDLSVFLLNRR